jgi:phosphoribosylaminoimidazole-succinocarboxamide synthase
LSGSHDRPHIEDENSSTATGSHGADSQAARCVAGVRFMRGGPLAAGLRESDRLEPALFSPATKAESGHDENITIATVIERQGPAVAAELERLARTVYEFGRATAEPRGIIVADTKFEFGQDADGGLWLIDEVMTPDSSRFWPADQYQPGQGQPSFDKQPLRDYLDAERAAGRWNGEAPPPPLPDSVITATSQRYLAVYELLTGKALDLKAFQ